MEAALTTRMLKIRFNTARQPAKDVRNTRDVGFKDVLKKEINKKEDVQKTREQQKEGIWNNKEKIITKEKKLEDEDKITKEEVNEKDDEKKRRDKINGLIENFLMNENTEKDVKNTDEIKELITKVADESGIELTKKELEKILENLMKKVDEVGPQDVETEEITLNTEKMLNEKTEKGNERHTAKGLNSEDVDDERETNNKNEEILNQSQDEISGFNFANEKTFDDKGKNSKDNKFKIQDLRGKGTEGKKDEGLKFDTGISEIIKDVEEADVAIDGIVENQPMDLQEQIDIINQVSEKVDVTLLEDKYEMVIKLKPDHLGKLTLQLSVENGTVTAKFLAESQRVKEALESNFQDLKDQLSKQGLVVENFSVSVGQENNNRDFSQNGLKRFGRKQNDIGRVSSINSYNDDIPGLSDRETIGYYRPDSTVSFSA